VYGRDTLALPPAKSLYQLWGSNMTATDYKHESIWMHLYELAFTQGYVNAGVKTRYVHAGADDAPVLIMLHGMGGSWENCFANLGPHAAHFNTYAFDMIGHGFSEKPGRTLAVSDYVEHLKNFMDTMGIEKASFLGISLGSWVATKFATLFPDRVGKVTMVSSWGRPAATTAQAELNRDVLAKARVIRMESVNNPTWPAMEAVFAALLADPKHRIPDLLALRQAIYRQPEMKRSMENILDGLESASWSRNALTDEELKRIPNPFLVIAAVDHKDVFLESGFAYAKLIPNAKLVEMTGAFHWAQWERADEFNRINLEFLLGK
jgi:2-hydroxy-6-oxonona-2,4-dienedioate hydrolase